MGRGSPLLRAALCLAAALGLTGAVPARAAVLCVDPAAPSCAATIQAAVDAAGAGDVVEIAAGVYPEPVSIATAGLTLRGTKGVFIDVSALPPETDAIRVTASDVTLQELSIAVGAGRGVLVSNAARIRIVGVEVRSADYGIELLGATPGAQIEGSRLRGCRRFLLFASDADGLQLLGNSFEGANDGVEIDGDGVRVEGNTFERTGGVFILGDGAIARRNRLKLARGGAIAIQGRTSLVEHNTIVDASSNGISVSGDGATIQENVLSRLGGHGISLGCDDECSGGRITRNRLDRVGENGLLVESPGANLVIEDNRITQTLSEGIFLEASGARLERNRVSGAGSMDFPCVFIRGDSNRIRENELASCSWDGLGVSGAGNVIERNRISDSADDGIDVYTGTANALRANGVSGASDNGIEISSAASSTALDGNLAAGVRAGICDAGTGTTGSDTPDATGCGAPGD